MSNTSTRSLVLSQPKAGQNEVSQITTLPHTVSSDGKVTEVTVEVPGVDPATVNVRFDNSILQVSCSRGEFTFPLNPTIDASKIKAGILWGMLTLTIPLPEAPEARTIKVSIHDAAPAKKPAAKSVAKGEEQFTSGE